MRSGRLQDQFPFVLPAILGRDVSGEVVAVGRGVAALRVGAKVLGLANATHAEYVVAGEEAWAELPPSLDIVDAAARPLVALAGLQRTDEVVRARPSDVVLVTGALGGVGRAAVYAAVSRGAKVLAGVRRKREGDTKSPGGVATIAPHEDSDFERIPHLDAIANPMPPRPMLPRLIPKG